MKKLIIKQLHETVEGKEKYRSKTFDGINESASDINLKEFGVAYASLLQGENKEINKVEITNLK